MELNFTASWAGSRDTTGIVTIYLNEFPVLVVPSVEHPGTYISNVWHDDGVELSESVAEDLAIQNTVMSVAQDILTAAAAHFSAALSGDNTD